MKRSARAPVDGWQWCGRTHYFHVGLSLCGAFAQQPNNPTHRTNPWPDETCEDCRQPSFLNRGTGHQEAVA